MGRHQENITRLVCGAITCTVSFCLLTCAFVNVAYADYNDLPNSYTDESGGNYNPEGTLFGTTSLLFTDTWFADETIFSQSLSGIFQAVQDKTAIYTAIVADCVRQSNNWLSQIHSCLDTVEYYIDDIYLANNQMLTQIRFDQDVNGTKTLRGIVADISSAMTANNASLQQIKDVFYTSDGYNYISYIKSNTDYLYTINNTLTSTANGTILYWLRISATNAQSNSTFLNTILSELRSSGYIGQQLANVNTNLTNIYNAITRVQSLQQFADGRTQWISYSYPTLPGENNRIYSWMSDLRTYLNNVRTYAQQLVDALGSGGYIGQQLADLNSKLNTISNNLTSYTYSDGSGGQVRYYWVSLLKPSDTGAQEWMNNVRNYIDNIRGYSANISSKIDSIKSNVDSIADALGSGGYIGQQLANVNTSLTNIYDAITRVQSLQQFADGRTQWISYSYPTLPGENNRIYSWMSDLRTYVGNLSNGITNLNTNLTNIYTAITRVQSLQEFADGRTQWISYSMPTLPGTNNRIYSWMSDLRTYAQNMSDGMSTLSTSLTNIYNAITRVQSLQEFADGRTQYISYSMVTLPGVNNRIYSWMSDLRTYLQNISSKPNIDLTSVTNKLNDILLAIQGLDLVFNIPTNWPDIIGDFDDLDFGEKVDDLIDELENLAPFGAIFLISNQINLLTQVEPLTDPSFVMDFNFAGTSENLTLDVSWLNDAKPLFNFITIFLLMYSLLIISMKYVRQEATS